MTERPNWLRRRWLDLREIVGLIRLGMTHHAPPICGASYYEERLYCCYRRRGHAGPHACGGFTWPHGEEG